MNAERYTASNQRSHVFSLGRVRISGETVREASFEEKRCRQRRRVSYWNGDREGAKQISTLDFHLCV